jgi:hypothetical protein
MGSGAAGASGVIRLPVAKTKRALREPMCTRPRKEPLMDQSPRAPFQNSDFKKSSKVSALLDRAARLEYALNYSSLLIIAGEQSMKRIGDWVVDATGLYNETMDYLIPAEDLCEARDGGVSEWAQHMIEKTWVEPEDFVPALRYVACSHCSVFDQSTAVQENWSKAHAYQELASAEAKRRLRIEDGFGISGEVASQLIRETRRLMDFAWRPRSWTSRQIKTAREIEDDEAPESDH